MIVFPIGTKFKHDDFKNVFVEITDHLGGEKCGIKWFGDKLVRRRSSLTTSTLVRKFSLVSRKLRMPTLQLPDPKPESPLKAVGDKILRALTLSNVGLVCEALYKIEYGEFRALDRRGRRGFCHYLRKLDANNDIVDAYVNYRNRKCG